MPKSSFHLIWPLLLAALWSGLLWAEPIEISKAEARLQGEAYLLHAEIQYHLNGTVLEALEHGVPLTMALHVQVLRQGAWFWEPDVVDLHIYRMLRFHPLTDLYEVVDLDSEHSQSFATRDIAIGALGEIQALPVVEKRLLQTGERYIIEMQARLDIESLPLTLRPLAYLTSDWNLSSGWLVRPLVPLQQPEPDNSHEP